jgi:hypothetical protein
MIVVVMFYVSLASMWITTVAAIADPVSKSHPTLMFFVSLLFGCFTSVFFHLKRDD